MDEGAPPGMTARMRRGDGRAERQRGAARPSAPRRPIAYFLKRPETAAAAFASVVHAIMWWRAAASGLMGREQWHQAAMCVGFLGCLGLTLLLCHTPWWARHRWVGPRMRAGKSNGWAWLRGMVHCQALLHLQLLAAEGQDSCVHSLLTPGEGSCVHSLLTPVLCSHAGRSSSPRFASSSPPSRPTDLQRCACAGSCGLHAPAWRPAVS